MKIWSLVSRWWSSSADSSSMNYRATLSKTLYRRDKQADSCESQSHTDTDRNSARAKPPLLSVKKPCRIICTCIKNSYFCQLFLWCSCASTYIIILYIFLVYCSLEMNIQVIEIDRKSIITYSLAFSQCSINYYPLGPQIVNPHMLRTYWVT